MEMSVVLDRPSFAAAPSQPPSSQEFVVLHWVRTCSVIRQLPAQASPRHPDRSGGFVVRVSLHRVTGPAITNVRMAAPCSVVKSWLVADRTMRPARMIPRLEWE